MGAAARDAHGRPGQPDDPGLQRHVGDDLGCGQLVVGDPLPAVLFQQAVPQGSPGRGGTFLQQGHIGFVGLADKGDLGKIHFVHILHQICQGVFFDFFQIDAGCLFFRRSFVFCGEEDLAVELDPNDVGVTVFDGDLTGIFRRLHGGFQVNIRGDLMEDHIDPFFIQHLVGCFPGSIIDTLQRLEPFFRVRAADAQGRCKGVPYFRHAGDPAGEGSFIDRRAQRQLH